MRVYQVDAFTKRKFQGNPAGVILDADGLTEVQMQEIARELNNTESAFVSRSSSSDADIDVRFFTPQTEVAMCGHNTVALHYVRALEGECRPGLFRQKTKAGIIPVKIVRTENDFEISMTQTLKEVEASPPTKFVESLLSALALSRSDLESECPIQVVSTGNRKLFLAVKSRRILNELRPNMEKLAEAGRSLNTTGVYVFSFDTADQGYLSTGRMFAPQIGIPEDPVTGMAIGPLGIYLVRNRLVKISEGATDFQFKALQGEAMGRPGEANVRVEIEGGNPVRVEVAGTAVVVFRTVMEI